MRRITSILALLAYLTILPATTASAFFFDDTLVSIDENSYSVDDFKRWWEFWKEDEKSSLPDTPEPYIDWLLLRREGKRMQLDETPDFTHQTRVFLQSRGLLMLKYETVNSRIKVTDADIKKRYEEQYQPQWLLQSFEFEDEKTALEAWQGLREGKLTIEELLQRSPDQNGPKSTAKSRVRPKTIDKKWAAIFKKLNVGEASDPRDQDKGPEFYYLLDKKDGDEEDFAKWREEIKNDLWREQEDTFTRQLLEELEKKYEVKIDKERLAALDLNAPMETFSDAPIITTNRENVSEKQFMAVIKKLVSTRKPAAHAAAGLEEGAADQLKADTVGNIIAQSVTNWESLDRHYEEQEPFKWQYEFNYNHRLVLAVEQILFSPSIEISDDEITHYYQENIKFYTQPEMAKLYIIDETQGPIEKFWADIVIGKDFHKMLKEYFGQSIKTQEVPVNHLDPEVKAVVEKLDDGETSQIFKAQGINVVVHLIEKIPEAPLPLDRVNKMVRSKLWKQKLLQKQNSYMDKLKSSSEIEIQERNWKKIQKELGGS